MCAVDIVEYKRKKEDKKEMFNKLIEELKTSRNDDVTRIARKILAELENEGYYNRMSTPIFRIIEEFGIKLYVTSFLDEGISGVIYANGTTKDGFGFDKVILMDEDEQLEHRRFVAAHELGHYLFDCLCEEKYDNKNILFCETYPKCNHESDKETRADLFAAELLMPEILFVEKYDDVMDKTKDIKFTIDFLSKYFKTKPSSIKKRIREVHI